MNRQTRKTWKDLYELMLSERSKTRRTLYTATNTVCEEFFWQTQYFIEMHGLKKFPMTRGKTPSTSRERTMELDRRMKQIIFSCVMFCFVLWFLPFILILLCNMTKVKMYFIRMYVQNLYKIAHCLREGVVREGVKGEKIRDILK